MAFTKALYYPTIDIPNEAWLKNAMLYWNKIHTILPITLQSHTQQLNLTRTERVFSDEGLLLPLVVDSHMPEIEGLLGDVLKFLDTPEGKEVLKVQDALKSDTFHGHQPQRHIRANEITSLHREKLPHEILERLAKDSAGDWISVDKRFGDFYMTLLATRLADKNHAGLLTHALVFDNLARSVIVDAPSPSIQDEKSGVVDELKFRYSYRYRRAEPSTLAQGMLARLVIEQIEIDPDTL